MTADLISELRTLLGPTGCLTGPEMAEVAKLSDKTAELTEDELPVALLRPESVDQVSQALAICHRHNQPVVPQGGMTGLAGGANVKPGEVALSLSRLSGIEEIDPIAGTMTVRAGTVLETAQRAAEEAGFLLPIDLGSRGSCQVGGVISTNAGGLRVIRQGMTRQHLLGIEAVLADGTVLSHLSKVTKDNSGYALGQLIAGSEGTLAVVTRAVLALKPLPRAVETALCALNNFDAVIRLLERARRDLAISAFEVMWSDFFVFGGGEGLFPEVPPFTVIIEAEGTGLMETLEAALEEGYVQDALVAQSLADARRIWSLREFGAPIRPIVNLYNLDISLAVGDMEAFAAACSAELRAEVPDIIIYVYGHVGDGNLHLTLDLPSTDPSLPERICRIAYGHVRARNGSISAEHGIGTYKRDWLSYSRSPAEIAAMRAIKAALDPKGLLNPGKVI